MDINDKILDDINSTGFISELKVGSLLRKNKWSTWHGETYLDHDSGKSREIDIIATNVLNSKPAKLHLEYSLVIDVKRMKKRPWVVFTVEKTKPFRSPGWGILHYGFNHNINFPLGGIDITNFKTTIDRYGIAFHEAFKPPDEPSKTYESLISTCKAAWFHTNKYKPSDEVEKFDGDQDIELYFFIPLIVLDGKLYSVYLDTVGEVHLNEESFIEVHLNYSSLKYKDTCFYPDIIHIDYLESYIKLIDKWAEGMFKSFEKIIIEKYRK